MIHVGLSLKIKRLANGKKQEEVAKAIGVTRATYTRYESEKRVPDIYMLCTIADYYNVSLDELVGRNWHPAKPTHSNAKVKRVLH